MILMPGSSGPTAEGQRGSVGVFPMIRSLWKIRQSSEKCPVEGSATETIYS